MTLKPLTIHGIVVSEKIIIELPKGITEIIQCKRGFWWVEREVEQLGHMSEWKRSEILLHEDTYPFKPIRTAVNFNKEKYKVREIEVTPGSDTIIVSDFNLNK